MWIIHDQLLCNRMSRKPGTSHGWALVLAAIFALGQCNAARGAVFTDPQWVSFQSAAAVPSALARRVLGDAVDAARPTDTLRGLLVVPEGEGPFPAVVLLHGCRGVLPSHRGWAQWLARQGFVALLVDSFLTRNAVSVCARGPDAPKAPVESGPGCSSRLLSTAGPDCGHPPPPWQWS